MDKKVDDIELLDALIEKGSKDVIEKLKKITEELSKDVTDNKKASLLAEQKICIKALQIFLEKQLKDLD